MASAKSNAVLIHPGETIYTRFELKGKKIILVNFSKEMDANAQVIFSFAPDAQKPRVFSLKVENKFPRDFTYKVEMRSLSKKQKANMPVTPVVAGKVAFELFPSQVEQLALNEFELAK